MSNQIAQQNSLMLQDALQSMTRDIAAQGKDIERLGSIEFPRARSPKNYLINGAADIQQRLNAGGGTVTNGQYGLDRWKHARDGTGGTVAVGNVAFTPGQILVPNEPTAFIRLNQTVNGSGQTYTGLQQFIEDVRTLAGQKVTVQGWARTGLATTLNLKFDESMGTGGSGATSSSIAPFVMAANTWQYISAVMDIPTLAGKTVGTGSALAFIAYIASAVTTLDLANMSIEPGVVATPYQYLKKSAADELRDCMRYFQKSFPYTTAPAQGAGIAGSYNIQPQVAGAAVTYGLFRPFAVPMRIAPAVTTYNPSAANAQARNVITGTDGTGVTISGTSSEAGIAFSITGNTTWAIGHRADLNYSLEADF